MKESVKSLSAHVWLLVILLPAFIFMFGCHRTAPASIGMTKQEVMAEKGQPDARWDGKDGN